MVDRIRYPTVSYLPFYYVFFQFLLLTIFNLQANILTTKDILSNLDCERAGWTTRPTNTVKLRKITVLSNTPHIYTIELERNVLFVLIKIFQASGSVQLIVKI